QVLSRMTKHSPCVSAPTEPWHQPRSIWALNKGSLTTLAWNWRSTTAPTRRPPWQPYRVMRSISGRWPPCRVSQPSRKALNSHPLDRHEVIQKMNVVGRNMVKTASTHHRIVVSAHQPI